MSPYILEPVNDGAKKPWEYWAEQQERSLQQALGQKLFEWLENNAEREDRD